MLKTTCVCNRCNKELPKKYAPKSQNLPDTDRSSYKGAFFNITDCLGASKQLDLCESCYDEFNNWLN